jgi:GT2 family glycosyltransferase
MDRRVSVVIATRDRLGRLRETLAYLRALPESPCVTLADNASSDGTIEFVRREHPEVRLIALARNLGAAARTIGVEATGSPYVAFSDDDSWWAPGSLALAADRLDAHPRLALLAARVLVGPEQVRDSICGEMATSRLPRCADLPGPAVLGFLACGAVVRRSAFLEVGGFEARFGVGGEEELLALDLASAGWGLAYCDDVVAHHHPGTTGPRPGRRRVQYRNALWSAWLRRPLRSALRQTIRILAHGLLDPVPRAAFSDAFVGLPWILRHRRIVPPEVERSLRILGR